jgi:hypothetical protein
VTIEQVDQPPEEVKEGIRGDSLAKKPKNTGYTGII